jgi:hypothetical protein
MATSNHNLITMLTFKTAVAIGLGLSSAVAVANCSCVCVEGAVRAVCDNSVEPRPMCGPTLCAPAPDIREPEPLAASPGKQWVFSSPPNTKLGEDTYYWMEVGEPPEEDPWDW